MASIIGRPARIRGNLARFRDGLQRSSDRHRGAAALALLLIAALGPTIGLLAAWLM